MIYFEAQQQGTQLGNPFADLGERAASALAITPRNFWLAIAAVAAGAFFGGKYFGRVFPEFARKTEWAEWGTAPWQRTELGVREYPIPRFNFALAGATGALSGATALFLAKRVAPAINGGG